MSALVIYNSPSRDLVLWNWSCNLRSLCSYLWTLFRILIIIPAPLASCTLAKIWWSIYNNGSMKLVIMTLCFKYCCPVWWPWGNIPQTPLPWNSFVHSFMQILTKPADVRNWVLTCLTNDSYSKHRVSNKGKLYLVSKSHCVIVSKFLPTCSETWPWASGHRNLPCHAMLILQYCFISNLMPMIFHKLQWDPLQSPHQWQFSVKLQSRKRNLLRDRKVIYVYLLVVTT